MFKTASILFLLMALLVLAAIGGIVWYFYMKIRYRTVPSNEALIVTGPNLGDPEKDKSIFKDDQGRYMKVIRGGGHRLRMFQTSTKISLQSFQLQLGTPKVYTKQGVGIYGEAVATVKVSDNLEGIVKYAEQFLGKKQKEISDEIEEVLGSNLRAILSKMTVEEINSDRESFNSQVREIAQDQLDQMGFKITSLGLTNITDDEGYLENLGVPQISEVKKRADIAESTNTRETKIHVAKMNEDIAKEQYQREMAIADSKKEKEIKDAKILAETSREKARSEAAYELEQEERRLEIEKKRLEIIQQEKERELKIKRLERENEVALEKQQVEVRKQQAEADYFTKTKESQALAKARIEEGKAEAAVIKEKSRAEVEAIEKRAEALNKYKDVILQEKVIEMLPEYAKAVSDSLSNVESIRILDGGNGEQVSSLPSVVTRTMANLQEGLGQVTGLDLENILKGLSDKKLNQSKEIEVLEDKKMDEKEEGFSLVDLISKSEEDNLNK